MADVLCMTHAGIRCGIPSKHVAAAQGPLPPADCIELWAHAAPEGQPSPRESVSRAIQIMTPDGPRWLLAAKALMVAITSEQLLVLPPLLVQLLDCPYIVSAALVGDEFVWLVDPRRIVAKRWPRLAASGLKTGPEASDAFPGHCRS